MKKANYEEPALLRVSLNSEDWILASSDDGNGQGGGVVLPDDEWVSQ